MTGDAAPGVYRHYKGRLYFVLGLSLHSESGEICVVYRPLYETGWQHLTHRPLSMFIEEVDVEGRRMPRFERMPS